MDPTLIYGDPDLGQCESYQCFFVTAMAFVIGRLRKKTVDRNCSPSTVVGDSSRARRSILPCGAAERAQPCPTAVRLTRKLRARAAAAQARTPARGRRTS